MKYIRASAEYVDLQNIHVCNYCNLLTIRLLRKKVNLSEIRVEREREREAVGQCTGTMYIKLELLIKNF